MMNSQEDTLLVLLGMPIEGFGEEYMVRFRLVLLNILALPMLRLLSSKGQRCKYF